MNNNMNNNIQEKKNYSKEVVSLFVFIGMYICVRFTESFVIPKIPSFITREVSSLIRLGPIIVPIIFGLSYIKKSSKFSKFSKFSKSSKSSKSSKKIFVKNSTPNTILENRMKLWM